MVYEPGRVCEICGCESPRVAVCGACEADARAGEANAAIAAEIERLRAEVESARIAAEGAVPGQEVLDAWRSVSRYVGHSGAHEDVCDAADVVGEWFSRVEAAKGGGGR